MICSRRLLMASILILVSMAGQAKFHALLVGVSEYENPGSNLRGPVNDVSELREQIARQWPKAEIHSLVNTEATKTNILQALERMTSLVQPEDKVLIYMSGHGTSRYDHKFAQRHGLPIAHGSGAFMPHDVVAKGDAETIMSSLMIGNRDMRPRLERLDRTGAETLVIMDACYSGNSVRSILKQKDTSSRHMPVFITSSRGQGDDDFLEGDIGDELIRDDPPPYPYKNIAFLSAASDSEEAKDINDTGRTLDNKPHGAFTDGLLRVLKGRIDADSNKDGRISNTELRLATTRYLDREGYGHTPQALPSPEDDGRQLRNRSLFPAPKIAPDISGAQRPLKISLDPGLEALAERIEQEPGMEIGRGQADIRIENRNNEWILRAGAGDAIGKLRAGDMGRAMFRLRQMRWLNQLSERQQQDNPFNLELNVVPGNRGNNFRFGEFLTFRFAVEKPAWLVVLDIDSEGKVVPLYPYQYHEATAPIAAGRGLFIPSEDPKKSICAQAPEGTDHLIALAFENKPEFLNRLPGRDALAWDDPSLLSWKGQLNQADSGIAVAVTKLRVIKGEGKACPN